MEIVALYTTWVEVDTMQKPLQKQSGTNLFLSPRVLWNGNENTVDCICFNWRL